MEPQSSQNALTCRLRFPAVFSSVSGGFFVDFRGARHSIQSLFTALAWGASFFGKSTKTYLPTTTNMTPKMKPEASKNLSKNEAKK